MTNKRLKASYTIEVALIFPLLLMIFCYTVWAGFFYYDKQVYTGLAWEIGFLQGRNFRAKEPIRKEALETYFSQRKDDKILLMNKGRIFLNSKRTDCVEILAFQNRKKLEVKATVKSTYPEKKLRRKWRDKHESNLAK